jgi:putative transposase
LCPDDDQELHEDIRARLLKQRTELLAIGNAADHVHVVLSLHPSMPIAEVVRTIKGGSSHFLNRADRPFAWQNGYWARSMDGDSLARVCDYVRDQRARHARGALDPSLEQNEGTRID